MPSRPAATELLAPALQRASPRYNPPPTPIASVAIHGAVAVAWVALFAFAFGHRGLAAWSVGLAYVVYDTLLQGFVGWKTWRLLKAPEPAAVPAGPGAPGTRRRPTVAVIVAAHNEARVLPVTLGALFAQDDAPDEILIADDGSTDDTPRVLAERWGLAPPAPGAVARVEVAGTAGTTALIWVRLPHGGKASALDECVLRTTADVVLTVDGDTLLDRRAIGAVRRAFAGDPALAGITGVITPVCRDTASGRILEWFQTYEYIRNFLSRYAWARVESLLLISGAFAGFRRQALLDVGGFDASFLVEDYELIHRMRRHAAAHGLDWRFRVLGDAQARTEAPGSVGAFLRQRRRWFGGFLQTQWWYRAMVGDRRLGALGLAMLPVKAIDTLQPLYGLTAFALLLVWGATGQFANVAPAFAVIGIKIGIDLAFHLWSVHLYRRWVGDRTRASFGLALLAALAEPFTFQLLRHTGALLGWVTFLTGRKVWGRQTRFGLDGAPHER